MAHQVTITVCDEVYTVNEMLEDLARPIVSETALEDAYRDMVADGEREREATEWIEGLVHDSFSGDRDAAR